MPVMLIAYQPAGRFAPDRLPSIFASLGDLLSLTPATWLLQSAHDPSSVLNRVRTSLPVGDNIFIVEVTHRYATNLPEGAKAWIYAHLH